MERSYGVFTRAFTLPSSVQPDKISASFAKGVLTVKLPKSKEARSRGREIAIAASSRVTRSPPGRGARKRSPAGHPMR